ncbi:enoyl-CoA hydratase-related protein [Duganella sp. LjRoot269]|jgi:3-hydroxyacyl-CoA dehydrogenase|uniref:enoyl-CoA hydratase-related protein n=1 Tax=Duganella sp. LjRoot269 TaxID=3342305 RepID=UPI003ED0BAE6
MDPVSYQPHGRIAVLTVNHPPVNTLSLDVRRGLMAAIERALHDNAVDAIIIIGGGATFVAGADINDFGKPYAPPSLYAIMDLIAADAKPVVAAIHGNALGGGMELALSCQWRIAAPGAMLGQPEVKLGLMPGGGGTQWWPRLAGPEIALNVCTGGAPLDALRAHACGVVDRIAGGELLADALAFADDIVSGRMARRRLVEASDKIRGIDPQLFSSYRARHREQWRGLLAPWKIVDCIEAACRLSFADGYALERKAFQECEHGPQSQAMIHLFFAERAAARWPGAQPARPAPPLRTVGLVGAGTAIAALARRLAHAGVTVAVDADGPGALARCDLIIAAAGDDGDATAALLRRLDHSAGPDTILAVMGATPALDALAGLTGRPDRVIGLQACLPGTADGLLEICHGDRTDPIVHAIAARLARQLGAAMVLTGQGARSLARRLREATRAAAAGLMAEGVARAAIVDSLHAFGFGQDSIGALCPAGGQPPPGARAVMRGEAILARLLHAMANEGARCMADRLALRAGDIDVAGVHGLGFPAHHGGPMHWAQGFARL